jgi:hypothetical protein
VPLRTVSDAYSGVWFLGSQVFGEKFLAGELLPYLKSESIPEKVDHSALFLRFHAILDSILSVKDFLLSLDTSFAHMLCQNVYSHMWLTLLQ